MVESSCEVMEAIGGYFSLELPLLEEYHKDAIKLNTGRNCLEYILRCRQYKKVYIPYYTCEVILEPFQKLNITYEFYHINLNLEITDKVDLGVGEALLYTNYYGIKQLYVEELASQYGSQLIVDNTQAFFAKPLQGIDTFYTCRKFFGVPDGAYLYCDETLDLPYEQDQSYDRMSFLTKRVDLGAEAGYADFCEQSNRLVGQPIKQMSNLTQRMMKSIDYNAIASHRRENFLLLHEVLQATNQLHISFTDNAIPMVYPYYLHQDNLRSRLIDSRVFVACYWPNVLTWANKDDIEFSLASYVLPLPIDQRYSEQDMNMIIALLR